MKTCDLCGEECNDENLKHLPLYVFGSEGIQTCLFCRQVLTDVARGMRSVEGRVELRMIKKSNKEKV